MEKRLSGLIAVLILSAAMAACSASEPVVPNQNEVMKPPPKVLADHPQMKKGPEGSELLYYQDVMRNRRATAKSLSSRSGCGAAT